MNDLENSPNPELGHYYERSWEGIFSNLKNTKVIKKYSPRTTKNINGKVNKERKIALIIKIGHNNHPISKLKFPAAKTLSLFLK